MNGIIRRAAWLAMAGMLAFVLGFGSAQAQAPATPKEKLDALVERMRKATDNFFETKWKDELSKEERDELYKQRPGREFIPEFEALAVEAKGTDVAAAARLQEFSVQCDFVLQPDAEKTLALLLSESIGSEDLKDLPSTLMYRYNQWAGEERCFTALGTLVEKSPHKTVKASALFSLGQMNCRGKSSDERKAQGRKYFERLIAEFGDVKGSRKTYKEAAEAFLFELDHLQIGMQAPDFETTDENGAKFKLSDYRGKIVVIDFWGNW
jgi:hypothetical protein